MQIPKYVDKIMQFVKMAKSSDSSVIVLSYNMEREVLYIREVGHIKPKFRIQLNQEAFYMFVEMDLDSVPDMYGYNVKIEGEKIYLW